MLANPEKFPHVKKEWGQAFVDWLISPAGKIEGKQLFFPNAGAPGA
jgi:tungstate transport system substrate-binding protein